MTDFEKMLEECIHILQVLPYIKDTQKVDREISKVVDLLLRNIELEDKGD